MMFKMLVELWLSIKKLVANIALNQAIWSYLLGNEVLHFLFTEHTHEYIYLFKIMSNFPYYEYNEILRDIQGD